MPALSSTFFHCFSLFLHTTASTQRRAPFRSRRNKCHTNQGSLVISSGQNSVRPMHLFGHNFDHDYYFELLDEEERAAQSIARCSTAHHDLIRAGPRANRTFLTARNPIPYATSSTEQLPVSAPSPPWRSSVLVASLGGSTYCAIAEGCVPKLGPLPPARSATSNCLAS